MAGPQTSPYGTRASAQISLLQNQVDKINTGSRNDVLVALLWIVHAADARLT